MAMILTHIFSLCLWIDAFFIRQIFNLCYGFVCVYIGDHGCVCGWIGYYDCSCFIASTLFMANEAVHLILDFPFMFIALSCELHLDYRINIYITVEFNFLIQLGILFLFVPLGSFFLSLSSFILRRSFIRLFEINTHVAQLGPKNKIQDEFPINILVEFRVLRVSMCTNQTVY